MHKPGARLCPRRPKPTRAGRRGQRTRGPTTGERTYEMENGIVGFATCLLVTAMVVFPLGGALKRRPWLFYLAAALLVVSYALYRYGGLFGSASLQVIAEPLRKGYMGSCLLAAVMFCGALPPASPARAKVQPIRAELSILSMIMFIPHIIAYLPPYLPRFAFLLQSGSPISYSMVVALVLTAIFVLLTVLSFKPIKSRVPFKAWKSVQRLSYFMMALLCAHIWLAIGRAALFGQSQSALLPLAIYTAVIVIYATLRIRRAIIDGKARSPR